MTKIMTRPFWRSRRGWRYCLFGFTFYLCAVIVVENIFATIYWSGFKSRDLNENDEYKAALYESRFTESSRSRSTSGTTTSIQLKQESTMTSSPTTTTKKEPTVEELEKEFYRRRDNKVNPYLYDLIVRSEKVTCNDATFLVILIHSYHPYTDKRTSIRNTWGSIVQNGTWPHLPPIKEGIKLVFVLGLHKDPGLNDLIREEAQKYDDIVQGNFYDSYKNMTLKSLLGLKFVSTYCSEAQYMLKNDDDMFINVPYLVNILKNRTAAIQRAIMGPYNIGSKVYRNGKWKMTKEEFPFPFYPPYESGAAYVISGDIVRELFETSEYVPPIFIDDVYITGILGKILNVTHEQQKGFAYWTNRPPRPCDIVKNLIISGTKMTPTLLASTWKQLVEGPNCKIPPGQKATIPPLRPPWEP